MKIKSKEITKKVQKWLQEHQNTRQISDAEVKQLKKQLEKGELIVPDDTIQHVIRSMVERDFLNDPVDNKKFKPDGFLKEQGWIRISRLPIAPVEDKKYAMYPRWQNAIATMHTLNNRLCYVLLRQDGETKLFLGAIPRTVGKKGKEAGSQLRQAVSSQMPGIGIEDADAVMDLQGLNVLGSCGAVTGVPSVRKITEYGEYQTMDQIAMGLRGNGNHEQNFAVVVVADPVPDQQIVETLRAMENLGSEVHALTQYTKTEGTNEGSTVSLAVSDGNNVGVNVGVGFSVGRAVEGSLDIGGSLGAFSSTSNVRGANVGRSDSVSQQYISKSAMYCEELFDKHIARMKAGRNLGFWKTGVYVLAESESNVRTIMGMLRAVYSGDDTYIEPIRTVALPANSGADSLVRLFRHLPYSYPPVAEVLGSLYEDYTTPMTTEELSIATSLPRRDVPGLRLIRNASRFATNPPKIKEKKDGGLPVRLGEVLDTGAPTHQSYRIDLNQLVRHTLVAGSNGSGKTTTCKHLLSKMQENNIPFLVIEPAKEEYLDWAIEQNKISGKKKILIYAPGSFMNGEVNDLHLNPFQPAAAKGAPINMLGHLDRFKSALLSSMPMGDVLPLILEETIYAHVKRYMDVEKLSLVHKANPIEGPYRDDGKLEYPLVREMAGTARDIIVGRKYAKEVESNISAAVQTRISALLLGWKEPLFSTARSTDFGKLFENNNVVINLSYLTDDRDKAFVMSVILIALWEYRESKYRFDKEYKKKADANQLMHLTLIEEAHHLMPRVGVDMVSGQNSQANASKMFGTMLKEVRAYGEGCVVVDQVPTELISDAIKNTNLKIIHRLLSADDIQAVAASMRLRPDQAGVIGELQQGEAIVCSDFDDAAAWVKVN
ncbi:MAG: ATP-binding protein [Firmicutes bacterium]|nr:ATP-binding protein [Bacillota bacterium]